MTRTHRCLLALAALCCTLAYAEIPPYIKVCGRRNPNLNECIKNSTSFLLPLLGKGIPELNVSPIEPLKIDRIVVANLPEFKAAATNVELRGMSNFAIKYLKIDLEKEEIYMETVFPKTFSKADFDVEAKILVPINEKGTIEMTTENTESTAVMRFKTVVRRGRTFLYFQTMSNKIMIKDFTANFSSNANSPIVEAINSVLASSHKEVIESMTPSLEKFIAAKILETANQLCKNFTFEELFPDTA